VEQKAADIEHGETKFMPVTLGSSQ